MNADQARMVKDDEQDGDAPEALYVGTKMTLAGRGAPLGVSLHQTPSRQTIAYGHKRQIGGPHIIDPRFSHVQKVRCGGSPRDPWECPGPALRTSELLFL